MAAKPFRAKTVVFLHPDLGIGGAERLVVDAAVGLQKLGHKVVIFTSHCDPKHCFDEARDGTLDVRVRGNTVVPPSLLGRFAILCAILRQAHLLLQIGLFTSELANLCPDVFFVDQLSAGLPLLRLLMPSTPTAPTATNAPPPPPPTTTTTNPRILFYIHFPDLLLARGRARWWKRLYRAPFDALEPWSMGFADALAVNSAFTRGVVAETWPALAKRAGKDGLRVVYPCVDVGEEAGAEKAAKTKGRAGGGAQPVQRDDALVWPGRARVLLSINRFERKKDIGLALRAFAALPQSVRRPTPQEERPEAAAAAAAASSGKKQKPAPPPPPPPPARLVLAGGYDPRVAENVQYHAELEALAESLGLTHTTARTIPTALAAAAASSTSDGPNGGSGAAADVLFLLSVPASLKTALLRGATLLLYTPAREHFGIVPLEAMAARLPVLAADSGGPRETVVDGVTGWLRDPADPRAWADVLARVLGGADERGAPLTEARRRDMGDAGRTRVREMFSAESMAAALDAAMRDMAAQPAPGRGGPVGWTAWMTVCVLGLLGALGALLAAAVWPRGGRHGM